MITVRQHLYNSYALDGYGIDNLRQYVQLFPQRAEAQLMKGYLLYNEYELIVAEGEDNSERNEDIDGLDLILVRT